MTGLLLVALMLAGSSPGADRVRVLSEKLALDLRDSRKCEVNPDNGYTQCRYRYKGLRFVHRKLMFPSGESSFVDIERLDPGNVGISITGSPCFAVSISSDNPDNVAAAYVNAKDGRIAADGKSIGCFP